MLTLIRREIDDHLLLYLLMLIFGCSWAALYANFYHTAIYSNADGPWPLAEVPEPVFRAHIPFLSLLMFVAFVFQQVQKAFDEKEKISTFLCTSTATRGQLLVSRWLSALTWLSCGLLPMAVVHAFYLSRAMQWSKVHYVEVLLPQLGLIVLVPISCYLLSQFLGLCQRTAASLLIDTVIAAVVITLVAVKGVFPPAIQQISIVLAVLSIAAGIGTWSKSKTISL